MSSISSSERMMKLMAYADGELEGAERAEVERWLATDAEAVRFANDLAHLGELVTLGHEGSEDAKAIAGFDVADAVMAKVSTDPAQAAGAPALPRGRNREAERALPGGSSRGRTGPPRNQENVVSLDRARGRRMKVAAGVAAALALAASVFLVTRQKDEVPMAQQTGTSVQPAPGSTGPGVDVDLVETPGHSVSVFYLPSESSLTTSVVVWVDEPSGEK